MRIYGMDFSSRPRRAKPITCVECALEGDVLRAGPAENWASFQAFEAALQRPGPWIAGIDFPFGQARKFIETIGWPRSWAGYVEYAETLGRRGFRAALDDYRARRREGDREHRRATDILAGAISPQKLYGTPVGLMFFEGAPRLRAAGVTIPGLQRGDPERIVVEAYPGVLARALIGRRSYKQDNRSKQTKEQHEARREIMRRITGDGIRRDYGLRVEACGDFADDPSGDRLDGLLCAVQAAWALSQKGTGFGAPREFDPLEGWIADPCRAGGGVT